MGLLSLENASLRFGGIVALDDVSIDVENGTITGLIGPNGAGKTTAFNVITRLYRLDSGDVRLRRALAAANTAAAASIKLGIARTFQNVELFPTMTVLENVLVGAHTVSRFKRESELRKRALETLELVGHRAACAQARGRAAVRNAASASSSHARSSPTRGCSCSTSLQAGSTTRRSRSSARSSQHLRDELKLTILLVEHHMNLVMRISDHVHVLNFGRTIASGTAGRPSSATPR